MYKYILQQHFLDHFICVLLQWSTFDNLNTFWHILNSAGPVKLFPGFQRHPAVAKSAHELMKHLKNHQQFDTENWRVKTLLRRISVRV